MKRLQQLGLAVLLSLLFSVTALAGDIGMPKAPPPPGEIGMPAPPPRPAGDIWLGSKSSRSPGDIWTPRASTFANDSVVTLALSLLPSILSVF